MTCPMCDRETVGTYRPFCSRRCADLDLGNWLSDRYSTPAEASEDAEFGLLSTPVSKPKPH